MPKCSGVSKRLFIGSLWFGMNPSLLAPKSPFYHLKHSRSVQKNCILASCLSGNNNTATESTDQQIQHTSQSCEVMSRMFPAYPPPHSPAAPYITKTHAGSCEEYTNRTAGKKFLPIQYKEQGLNIIMRKAKALGGARQPREPKHQAKDLSVK